MNRNKKDYVSLTMAKRLRDKGFNEVCGAAYFTDSVSVSPLLFGMYSNTEGDYYTPGCIAVPLLYEAQNWLRRKYHTYVNVIPLERPHENKNFSFDINHFDEHNEWEWGWEREPDNYYYTYEMALTAGIYEALNMI